MQEISPVLIALCGFAFVLIGLVFVVGAMLAGLTANKVVGPLMSVLGVMGNNTQNNDEDIDRRYEDRSESRPRGQSLSAQDLRARAQSAQSTDIGGAAQSYRQPPIQQPPPTIPSAPMTSQSAPPSFTPPLPKQPTPDFTQSQPPLNTNTTPPSLEDFDPKQYNLRNMPRRQPPTSLPNRRDRQQRDDNEDMLGGLLGNEEEGEG